MWGKGGETRRTGGEVNAVDRFKIRRERFNLLARYLVSLSTSEGRIEEKALEFRNFSQLLFIPRLITTTLLLCSSLINLLSPENTFPDKVPRVVAPSQTKEARQIRLQHSSRRKKIN